MSRTKKIAILAIIAMVLTLIPGAALFAADDSNRISGASRIETAIAIADAGWTSAGAVVVAPADDANLVDALAAAPLAGQENAPILLTYKAALNPAVKAKIAALGANKVYVIGAISDAVADELKAMSGVTVEVLKGAGRQATAAAVNAKLTAPAGTFVVGFDAVPDALSVASYAAKNKFAIVLANYDGSVDSAALVGSTTYVLGGPTLVKDVAGATRMYGANRFDTNKAVFEGLSFGVSKVYVANGLSLVDALAVAPLAAKADAFVALASATDVAAAGAVNAKLAADSQVIAVGGTGAVSDDVLAKVGLGLTDPVTAAVVVKNYDDDTRNQYVAFTVNGKAATVEAINSLGWDLEFSAGQSKNDTSTETNNLFADITTGLLKNTLTQGDYYVQLTLTKGSDIIISNPAKITIKNLNLTATGISDYKLTNTGILAGEDMNSTKLYVNDVATFEEITVTAGTSKEDIPYTGDEFSLKTSNAGVISKVDNVITAETPGTASITITYGNATKVISFTVVDDEREAKSVKVKKVSDGSTVTSLKLQKGTTTDVKAVVLDQYGDPYAYIAAPDVTVANTNVADVGTFAGTGLFTVTAKATGSTTMKFTNGGVNLGTFSVTVSDDPVVTKKTLELFKVDNNDKYNALDGAIAALGNAGSKDDFSTDATLDYADDNLVIYQVSKYNAAGIRLGASDLVGASKVLPADPDFDFAKDVVQSKAGVLDAATGLYDTNTKLVIVAGDQAGTATIKIKDYSGTTHIIKVTVVNNGYSIKSISLKTPPTSDYGRTYKWSSVLNYTSTGKDPIITGVTLSKAAAQEIRFDRANNQFYIDKNSNGIYDDGAAAIVGTFVMTYTGSGFTTGTDSDNADTITSAPGTDGTIVFKVLNADNKVVASKSITIDI